MLHRLAPRGPAVLAALLALLGAGCAGVQTDPRAELWRERLAEGDRALHHGRYAESEEALVAALHQAEAFGPDDPRLAESLDDLGDLYFAQGKYALAEPLLVRALAITEKIYGHGSLQAASGLLYLADLENLRGSSAEAKRLYQKGLSILESHGRTIDLASRLNEVALLYQSQGRDDDAEQAYLRALALTERSFGKEHPLVASRLDDLALLYQSQGRYALAEPLYLRALEILEKNQSRALDGPLGDLALFYEAQERYGEAEPFYRKALAWTEQTFGPRSRRLVPILENYASLLRRLHREAQAEPLERRARIISGRRAGKPPS
jgi:tetratricopeptide (TPR) repeat protein